MFNKRVAPDWTLGHAADGLGEEFKSLETSVQACIWSDDTSAQRVLDAIANEENQ